jgi:hypothetical protein
MGRAVVTHSAKSNKKGGRLRATLPRSGLICASYTTLFWSGQAKQEKQPLFEKSGAKTFLKLGRRQRNKHGPEWQSFFATFCSQKVAFLICLAPATETGACAPVSVRTANYAE